MHSSRTGCRRAFPTFCLGKWALSRFPPTRSSTFTPLKTSPSQMQYSNPESAPRLADLFSLKGRTALIVGGFGLLGGQISYAFAELGAEIIIASRNEAACNTFIS